MPGSTSSTPPTCTRAESLQEIVRTALSGERRENVVLATKFHGTMGEDPNQAGNSRRWIMREVEASLKRLQTDWIDLYQVHRWDPWTDHEETLGALSDLVSQGKVRYTRLLNLPGGTDRQGAMGRARARLPTLRMRAAAVLNPRAWDRGRRAAHLPGVWDRRYPLEPARGRLVVGTLAQGSGRSTSRRSAMIPQRYDLSIPANQAKLEAADALGQLADESGISLIHMALAFVIRHPAVTAAIIGPRTMEQLESQLGATDVQLDDAVLDRIDEIVAPGSTINPTDAGWTNPALAATARRR